MLSHSRQEINCYSYKSPVTRCPAKKRPDTKHPSKKRLPKKCSAMKRLDQFDHLHYKYDLKTVNFTAFTKRP